MNKKVALLIAFSVSIFIAGVLSELRFSDEIMHFWFARDWYESGKRPVYNQLVDTIKEYQYYRYYEMGPLWHFGLMLIWKICGGVSKTAAQLYHATFYVLLIFGTYLLAKEMYGKKAGWYAAVVTATTPMFVAFGIMFFIDMPIAALVPFGLYFIVKKRYLWAGVLMGLMFITKRNSYFLFPTFFLFTLRGKSLPVISRLKNSLIFCVLVLAIVLPDFIFRYNSLGGLLKAGDKGKIIQVVDSYATAFKKIFSCFPPNFSGPHAPKITSPTSKWRTFLPSDIRRTRNIAKYLGLCLLILLGIYLFKFRQLFKKQDLLLALPVIVYLPLYAFFFGGWWAVRYLAPVIPLLAILVSKTFTTDKNKRLGYLIIALCLAQFAGTLAFVSTERRITSDEKEGLDYIKDEVPRSSRILIPEEFFISYYTGRPTAWFNTFRRLDYHNLLWGNQPEERRNILKKYEIRYILIPKKRTYDDSRVRHFGGYPQSFVEGADSLAFLRKVYENSSISLWQVVLKFSHKRMEDE